MSYVLSCISDFVQNFDTVSILP